MRFKTHVEKKNMITIAQRLEEEKWMYLIIMFLYQHEVGMYTVLGYTCI